MPNTQEALRPAPHRRALWWPWILMPLATLALFYALWTMRHQPGPGNSTSGVATDLSQP